MELKMLPRGVQSLLQSSSHINTYKKVVEELVYNALDAQANSIAVRINVQDQSISVIDNGCGIRKCDFKNVGLQHMTSKFINTYNLKAVSNNYGYKGSALASIIDISKEVNIISRHELTKDTWAKTFKNGNVIEVVDAPNRPSKGTTVQINGFLYNHTILRKTLNPIKELQNIKQLLEQLSLIHNNVSYSLRDDVSNEIVFKMPKSKDIYQKLYVMFDIERNNIQEISVEKKENKVEAFIGKEINHKVQWIYLNRRFIDYCTLHKYIDNYLERYLNVHVNTFIKKNMHEYEQNAQSVKKKKLPFYIIFISCPYNTYDLNQIANKTLLEFNSWDPIKVLLEKLVKFYVGDIKMQEVKNTECKIVPIDNNVDTRDQVKVIVKKVLGKNANITQMQNGIKGKCVKRKKKITVIKLLHSLKDKPNEFSLNHLHKSVVINKKPNIQTKCQMDEMRPQIKSKIRSRSTITIKANVKDHNKDINTPSNSITNRLDRTFEQTSQIAMHYVKGNCQNFIDNTEKLSKNKYDIQDKDKSSVKSKFQKSSKKITIRKKVNRITLDSYMSIPQALQRLGKLDKYINQCIGSSKVASHFKSREDLIHTVLDKPSLTSTLCNYDITINKTRETLPMESYFFSGGNLDKTMNSFLTYDSHKWNYSSYNRNVTKVGGLYKNHDKQNNNYRHDLYVARKSRGNFKTTKVNNFGMNTMPRVSNKSKILTYKKLTKMPFNVNATLNSNESPYTIDYFSSQASQSNLHYFSRMKQYDPKRDVNNVFVKNSHNNNLREHTINKEAIDCDIETEPCVPKNVIFVSESLPKPNVKDKLTHSLEPLEMCEIVMLSPDVIKDTINLYSKTEPNNKSSYIKMNYPITKQFNITYNLNSELSCRHVENILPSCHDINKQRSNERANLVADIYNYNKANDEIIQTHDYIMNEANSLRKDQIELNNNQTTHNENIHGQLSHADLTTNFYNCSQANVEFIQTYNNINETNNFREEQFACNNDNPIQTKNTNDGQISNNVSAELENNICNDADNETIQTEYNSINEANNLKEPHIELNNDKGTQNIICNTNNSLNFDDTNNNYTQRFDKKGQLHFLQKKTGMTVASKISVDNKKFKLSDRNCILPKGLSPIFTNCNTKQNIVYEMNSNDYYNDRLYDEFKKDIQVGSKIFEANIQNVNELTTKEIGKVNNRLKKDNADIVFNANSLKSLEVLAQVDNKFIAAKIKVKGVHAVDCGEYLVLFDQHAVHERIRLESNINDYMSDGKWKYVYLDSFSLQLSTEEAIYLHNYKDKFLGFGLKWTLINDREIAVTAIPQAVMGKNIRNPELIINAIKKLIQEEIKAIKEQQGSVSIYPQTIMELLFSEACRYAIKFGQKLTKDQCTELLSSLQKCRTPFQCAHGRPDMAVLLELKSEEHKYEINHNKLFTFKKQMAK